MSYRYFILFGVLTFVFLLFVSQVPAVDGPAGGESFAFLDQGISARAVGFGGAFTAVADDASAFLYNPAGLGQLEEGELSLGFSRPFTELPGYNISYLGLAKPLAIGFGTLGTLGAGFVHMRFGEMEEVDFGPTGRTFIPTETLIALAWGKGFGGDIEEEILPSTYIGFNFKIFYSKLDKYSDSGFGIDIGFMRYFHSLFRIAFTIENLVSPNIRLKEQSDIPLQHFRLGTAFGSLYGFTASGEMEVDLEGRLSGRFGGEFTLMELLSVRGGYRTATDEPFAGVGVRLKMLGVDYAVSFPEQFGLSHRIGITYFM